jgi:hypothetical protein
MNPRLRAQGAGAQPTPPGITPSSQTAARSGPDGALRARTFFAVLLPLSLTLVCCHLLPLQPAKCGDGGGGLRTPFSGREACVLHNFLITGGGDGYFFILPSHGNFNPSSFFLHFSEITPPQLPLCSFRKKTTYLLIPIHDHHRCLLLQPN